MAGKRRPFPETFLWGAALSEYQNSGALNCPDSNWAHWEATRFKNGKPHIVHNQKSGKADDFWHSYAADIKLMLKVGINSLRFSIEWSVIEPQEGQFNEQALQYYYKRCKALQEAGITPMITLHHFTHPQWFELLGAFEKEENIDYFIRFCKKVFDLLASCVQLWCTINEPAIYAFQGYIRGVFPPGKKNIFTALRVLKNLMQAHTQVYATLKAMPHGHHVHIGFIHQCLAFKPYNTINPLERVTAYVLNYFVDQLTLNFCFSQFFKIYIPGVIHLEYRAPHDQKLADFIGINYYSRVLVRSQWSIRQPLISAHYPHEIMTDMPYAIYPNGLYDTIKKISTLNIPIYITENGIADAQDTRRNLFLKHYLHALEKALKKGFDVRGYYYWTLMDNFEWNEGYTMKFGLYSVNFETQERQLRPGARYYADFIKSHS
jgi:beta-glucosidase